MRPTYETESDREREEACAKRILSRLGAGAMMVKLNGQYSRIDRLALRPGKKPLWIEIKCRSARSDSYPSLMLSCAKWQAGVEMADATGGQFVIVAAYTDGDYAYTYKREHVNSGEVQVVFGGRTLHTRDAGDVEPVVMIPKQFFRGLK
jgi:hypothetical protein